MDFSGIPLNVKRVYPIIFVIDTLGAMSGDFIDAINSEMKSLIEDKIPNNEENIYHVKTPKN